MELVLVSRLKARTNVNNPPRVLPPSRDTDATVEIIDWTTNVSMNANLTASSSFQGIPARFEIILVDSLHKSVEFLSPPSAKTRPIVRE